MKLFTISALIEERMLWETMQFLETKRAREITARPHFTEPVEAGMSATPAKPNGAARSSTTAHLVRAAIANALKENKEITVKGIRESSRLNRGSVDRAFFALNRDGYIKRVGPGTYVKGKGEIEEARG